MEARTLKARRECRERERTDLERVERIGIGAELSTVRCVVEVGVGTEGTGQWEEGGRGWEECATGEDGIGGSAATRSGKKSLGGRKEPA